MSNDESWDSTVPIPIQSSFEDLYSETPGEIEAARGKPPSPAPQSIGRYRILGTLGRGGMGEVFLAIDNELSRTIAVKRLRSDRADSQIARKRFEAEARITAQLQHPGILPVYKYLTEEDGRYYTMRPVEGVTFADLIQSLSEGDPSFLDEWPVSRLVRLFLQAANTVAFAHSRGVVHRDLKPSNVMVGPFEEVLVLDWGMAKVLPDTTDSRQQPEGGSRLHSLELPIEDTDAGFLLGTPLYMAPERLQGQPSTPLSDIFALGCILYELLALREPWRAPSLRGLLEAQRHPPHSPSLLQPGRRIPADLGAISLKALAFEPSERFASVTELSRAVSHALEGRASWKLETRSAEAGRWQSAGARLKEEGGTLLVRSAGARGLFRYFCRDRYSDDLRIEFELNLQKGVHELSVWLHCADPRGNMHQRGYRLVVLPGRGGTASMQRSGRRVAGAKSPEIHPGRWHRVAVLREDDRMSLRVDGHEVYAYVDPIPLRGGFFGLSGRTIGLRIRGLRVHSRGASARVSCLAVPDALFNRMLYEDAQTEYARIAASHPGREEGRLAAFRSGLCPLEMARNERDPEVRQILLQDAQDTFARYARTRDSCLTAFGHALVAAERKDSRRLYDALTRALEEFPGDPHVTTVSEWILGRIHSLDRSERQVLCDLVPLAIVHCRDDWGRQLVRDFVRSVRNEWECPAFMTGRSAFKEGDPVSQAEARLFFGFWSGRASLIEDVLRDLLRSRSLRPHLFADGVLSLLELGHLDVALRLTEELGPDLKRQLGRHADRWLGACRCAVVADHGDVEESGRILSDLDADPGNRAYNAARLRLARSFHHQGKTSRALRVLRPRAKADRFAREHQAWLHLLLGDSERAERQLRAFVERNEHRTGKNLSNFLLGASLLLRQREEEALHVFRLLEPSPWPRTWTLGSHYALGRLGAGRVESYIEGAFPWERTQLKAQAELLAHARGQTLDSLPSCLRS